MKLVRYQQASAIHWGAIDTQTGSIRRIEGDFAQWAPEVTAHGPGVLRFDGSTAQVTQVKLLAPLHTTGYVYWVGLNYPNWPKPEKADPPIFFKARTAIVGPEQTIRFPQLIRVQAQAYFVYEIELVAVIGRAVTDPRNALRDVLGYTIGNSGALRNNRSHCVGADLVGRSSARNSCAIGPWIVTKDELGGERHPDLAMTMRINGVVTQRSRTGRMIWDMNRLLQEVGYRSKLFCGDVIETGTCGYVGVQDGVYQPRDVAEAEIEGIGVLRNTVEEVDPYPVWGGQRSQGPRKVPPIYPIPLQDEVAR